MMYFQLKTVCKIENNISKFQKILKNHDVFSIENSVV
jgi:hypothetical protein